MCSFGVAVKLWKVSLFVRSFSTYFSHLSCFYISSTTRQTMSSSSPFSLVSTAVLRLLNCIKDLHFKSVILLCESSSFVVLWLIFCCRSSYWTVEGDESGWDKSGRCHCRFYSVHQDCGQTLIQIFHQGIWHCEWEEVCDSAGVWRFPHPSLVVYYNIVSERCDSAGLVETEVG